MSQRANESSQPVCVWVCVCVLFFMMNSHRCILFNKWICDSDRCFLVRSFVRFWMLCALLMCSYKSLVFMVCIWNAANVIMAGVVPLRESLFELKLSWLALTYENVCLCLYIYMHFNGTFEINKYQNKGLYGYGMCLVLSVLLNSILY